MVGWLVLGGGYDISTNVGHLMPNPVYKYNYKYKFDIWIVIAYLVDNTFTSQRLFVSTLLNGFKYYYWEIEVIDTSTQGSGFVWFGFIAHQPLLVIYAKSIFKQTILFQIILFDIQNEFYFKIFSLA